MSTLMAPVLLACSGTQVALLEAPTTFTVEWADDAIRGEGGPFVWATDKLRRTSKSLVGLSGEKIFVGSGNRTTLEMTLSADGSTANWVVLEPTRKKARYRVGISGTAACEMSMKKAEA